MKLIAIGDNVTDCYVDEGVYFPGGNAVNVAANCKKNGAEKVNYIGVFGNDDKADYIRQCLEEEGQLLDAFQWMQQREKELRTQLEEVIPPYVERLQEAGEKLREILG